MATNMRFLPRMHLRRTQDFERVYQSGQRAGDAHLLVFAMMNNLGYSRLGLSVSRKHGSAVRRNLKRRRMKECFRVIRQRLPAGLDFVLVPRHNIDSTLADYQESLIQLAELLTRRLRRSSQRARPESIRPAPNAEAESGPLP